MEQLGLFLELVTLAKMSNRGRRALVTTGDQEPDGHSDGAPEIISCELALWNSLSPVHLLGTFSPAPLSLLYHISKGLFTVFSGITSSTACYMEYFTGKQKQGHK